MSTTATFERDGTVPRPPVAGAVAFLVLSLPAGVLAFSVLVTLFAAGIGTAVVWVGLPVLALAVVLCRGGAHLERLRVHAMLRTYVAPPPPVREGPGRWKAVLRDGATWKGLTYLLLLLPIGIVEFTLVVTFWSVSLGLLTLPVYFRFLPTGSWRFPDWDRPWIVVDSIVDALPFAGLGALLLALTILLTRGLAAMHARYARSILGPPASVLAESARQYQSSGV